MVELSHSGKMVYEHDRDRFLLSLFVPDSGREAVLAVCALSVELAQIQGKTSEELIGQVRLAWWQERIQDLYAGKPTQGHPVLEALVPVIAHVPQDMLVGLVEKYRESLAEIPSPAGGGLGWGHNETRSETCPPPNLPPAGGGIVDEISLQLLGSLCPDAEPRWRKAHGIISGHRKRYGKRRNGWMIIRLLIGF